MAAIKKVQEAPALELGALLDAGDGAMVTLVAGDTRLAAHRAVLAARSPVFEAMFSHKTLEASSGQVAIPDVEGAVLRQLVSYIYTFRAPQLHKMAHKLLAAADKYGISGLKAECEKVIAAQLSVENVVAAAVLAVQHSCVALKRAAVVFVKARTHQVMATQGWADAVVNNPYTFVEFTRLIADPSTKSSRSTPSTRPHSDHGQSSVAATSPMALHNISPPDDDAVCSMRTLPKEEKDRKLIEAAEKGTVDELQTLLAAGADVGARNEERMTALHKAASEGHMDVVRCLLGSGAEVNARDNGQNTPLHLAAWSGRTAVVRLLVASSADPNARDESGRTPLHDGVRCGYVEVVTALLEVGADKGARDEDGKTPMDLAMENNRHQIIEMLT